MSCVVFVGAETNTRFDDVIDFDEGRRMKTGNVSGLPRPAVAPKANRVIGARDNGERVTKVKGRL